MLQSVEVDLGGGRIVTLETGRMAKQANGAVVVKSGDSVVLVTAVTAAEPKPGASFFPITVDYRADFDWHYLRDRPALARLYEVAKTAQWNASTDLDWSMEVNPELPDVLLPEEFAPMYGHPATKNLSENEKAEQRRATLSWMLSQFLHGEQGALFAACIPAIPYAPSAAFIARERAKLPTADGELPRIAIVADGIGAMHGVTRTIERPFACSVSTSPRSVASSHTGSLGQEVRHASIVS